MCIFEWRFALSHLGRCWCAFIFGSCLGGFMSPSFRPRPNSPDRNALMPLKTFSTPPIACHLSPAFRQCFLFHVSSSRYSSSSQQPVRRYPTNNGATTTMLLIAMTVKLFWKGENGKQISLAYSTPSHHPHRRTLSSSEKADYITAVKCLQSLPSQDTAVPAAKSRFDEFQAYHIEQSDNGIHVTVRMIWIHCLFTPLMVLLGPIPSMA